jgi:hypothetical protein
MRACFAALVIAAVLLGTPAATAKEFEPGDFRVCNHTRCATITNVRVLRLFSSFYYGRGNVTVADPPRAGARAFELRVDGAVAGIAASSQLDRALVYGLNCSRFRRGIWYRLPRRAAAELRLLTAHFRSFRVTGVVPRSC